MKSEHGIKHKYISTACQHDKHPECRRRCKFCPARCLCWCHENDPPLEDEYAGSSET